MKNAQLTWELHPVAHAIFIQCIGHAVVTVWKPGTPRGDDRAPQRAVKSTACRVQPQAWHDGGMAGRRALQAPLFNFVMLSAVSAVR